MASSSQKPVENDVDAVEQRLAFRLRILGVEHLDRFFRYPPMVFGDQHDELGGVAHAAHGDVQPVGHGLVEHPQAIVGVGQAKSAASTAQPRSCLQHDPLHQWRSAGRSFAHGPAEPRSDHHIDVTCAEPVDHCGHVFDAVLAVAVKGGKDLGARLLAGVLDSGLNGRPLAQVDRMAYEVSTGPPGDVAGAVGAAVVHADDVVED